jgi:hypothetical protein
MKIKKHNLIGFFLFAGLLSLQSQNYVATARLDSNTILVGDQVNLRFSFSAKEVISVLFPVYCDTCIQGIEIVKRSGIDTVSDENGYKLTQQFTITAFDSGEYVIPSIAFYSLDSILLAETEELLLNVQTIAVDTTLAIKDIKEPLSAPITIRELLPYIVVALLVFGLIVGGIFLIRYLNNRKKPQPAEKQKPKIPAHILALQDLEALWRKKLCQAGYIKQYYSELTDIVRVYIENRWNIAAMEMVSSEIITALSSENIPAETIRKLEQVLLLSDMVKFAKSNPLADENSACYQHIVEFVQITKLVSNE